MKLIFCGECTDIIKLQNQSRVCGCGKSGGYYTDQINAVIFGDAIPIGIANNNFFQALILNQSIKGREGVTFTAFVIPEPCSTIERK